MCLKALFGALCYPTNLNGDFYEQRQNDWKEIFEYLGA